MDYWDTALGQAEQARNYVEGTQYGQQYVGGTSGSEGGGYAAPVADWAAPITTPDWSGPAAYGLSGVQPGQVYGGGAEQEAAAALARIRQFDPNASIVTVPTTVGGENAVDSFQYQLNFDPSLLPQPVAPGGVLAGPYGRDQLFNTSDAAFIYDPNYGVMTDPRNIRPDTSGNWLDIVGPLAVSAFGFGIPAIAAGLTGGAIGGAAGSVSMPWWGNAGLSTVRQVGSGNINPVNLVSSWAPGLSAFGVPSELAQGLQYGTRAYNAYDAYERGQQQPQQVQTQLTYNPQNYGNMKQKLVDSGDTTPVAEAYAYSPYYGSRGDKGQ